MENFHISRVENGKIKYIHHTISLSSPALPTLLLLLEIQRAAAPPIDEATCRKARRLESVDPSASYRDRECQGLGHDCTVRLELFESLQQTVESTN